MRSVFLLAMAVVPAACNSAARTETQQLVTAVDRFRKAPNAEKPSHVDAIKSSPCTDAAVCRARATCVESAEATARGLSLTSQAGSLMKSVVPGDDTTPIERMLDDAKRSNEIGRQKLDECDDQLIALKRKYGV